MSRRSSTATSRRADGTPRSDGGLSLVALVASVAIIFIGFLVAAPSWNYLSRYEREQELLFRGFEIVKGIRGWQRLRGGELPTSLQLMVEQRVLRTAYPDPTTEHLPNGGVWCFASPAQPRPECMMLNAAVAPGSGAGGGGSASGTESGPAVAARQFEPSLRVARAGFLLFAAPDEPPVRIAQNIPPPGAPGSQGPCGPPGSGFSGVYSRTTDESYAVFNTKNNYNNWCFSIDTVPEMVLTMKHLRVAQMTFTDERRPKFTGKGKGDPRKRDGGKRRRDENTSPEDPFAEAPPEP